MAKIIVVSDTHLAPHTDKFLANWNAAKKWIRDNEPDLVINAGDLTLDGSNQPTQLDYVRGLHDKLGAPWLAIPGNHDVGEHPAHAEVPHKQRPVTLERCQEWQARVGPNFWHHDTENWRLIGLNAQIMGSGLPIDNEQREWCRSIVASSEDRKLAVFVHKPFFLHTADDPYSGWTIAPAAREAYAFLTDHPNLWSIMSGHMHSYRHEASARINRVWSPSLAFSFTEKIQDTMIPGISCVGLLAIGLHDDRVHVTLIKPTGLAGMWTNEDIPLTNERKGGIGAGSHPLGIGAPSV